jgi:2-polyprenyl-6-hydroxyphenyl methylase / 3-demethylubiquinone-9 3-methyltransferase
MKSSQELKGIYDEHYAGAYDETHPAIRLERLLTLIDVSREENMVDFACGSGMLMPYLAPRVRSYTGVDFSEPFIKLAQAKQRSLGVSNARFECASIEAFSQKYPAAFDVGFAMDFSEHVYDAEWLEILKSMRISLVKGGRLYQHTPNGNFFMEIMKNHGFILKQFPDHVAVRSFERNVAMLQEAGYKIKRAMLLPHYNILKVLHPVSYIPLVGKYFKARVFIEAVNP